MSCFISHSSALKYWRSESVQSKAVMSRAKPQAGQVPETGLIAKAKAFATGEETPTLHLAVAQSSGRTRVSGVSNHVWMGPSSTGSFVQIDKGIYVSTPESCFLQLASVLPFIKLIEVGFEFCGRYALRPQNAKGFESRKPLTTVASMNRYLAKSAGLKGSKNARRALKYLAENSASPMETILTLFLCLPPSLGGYGMELPSLNHRIEIPERLKKPNGRQFFRCDLYWPAARLAVEYDSDMFHTGTNRIAHDSQRRNDLIHQDISVVSVTRSQVTDARELDKIAQQIAKLLKKRRLRCEQQGVLTRRYELRQLLLGAPPLAADGGGCRTLAGAPAEYIDL